ncbi:hypothetical protein CVIRNUC_010159 [Coccomyxa viridis]|uniref:S-adenosyl-L-methionine-dependent methyltransferase n=1 Tax=Coccomyxa viridis TaxID=1274662 RepID=A0AAV1IL40_9CHLO|nr:hypothetical protein CVIRNUC_010159 [Coccomyxa viridis]
MKPSTMHLLSRSLLCRRALDAGVFIVHRSREAKISRGAACVPNTTGGKMAAEAEYADMWINMWKDGILPGQRFDKTRAAPSLVRALEEGTLSVKNKRVLIPGCGRGYDVILMAQHGATPAMGLDLVEDAVKAAEMYKDSTDASNNVKARAWYTDGDFFKWTDEAGPFDVAYDYTFLCALQPHDRKKWAQRYAQLIKPGGQLATLIFPVDASKDRNHGPPFPVTPELYADLLEPLGFARVYFREIEPHESHERRQGQGYFAVWTLKPEA